VLGTRLTDGAEKDCVLECCEFSQYLPSVNFVFFAVMGLELRVYT
jgi:hypothetical protein